MNKDNIIIDQDELNRKEQERNLHRDHIENCAVFAKEVLRGAFIINGAAVTAIMASQKFDNLKFAVFVFAIGALLALISGYFSYIYQLKIALTFKFHITANDDDKKYLYYDEKEMKPALYTGIASLVFFVIGLIWSACSLG